MPPLVSRGPPSLRCAMSRRTLSFVLVAAAAAFLLGRASADSASEKKSRVFEIRTYAGAPHGFSNEARPENYREEAAAEAWAATAHFLKQHFQGS